MTAVDAGFTVCVYCASSDAASAADRASAAALGNGIAARGWRLVYGGGNVGLMGEVARAALAAGGRVTGVIPHRLVERELALDGLTELLRTETMRQRKDLMDARSDAFVVLPGGIGTLEELVEMLTLKLLGFHARPVVILDPRGFWEPLFELLRHMVTERLAEPDLLALYEVARDVPAALDALRAPARGPVEPTEGALLEAAEGPPGVSDRRRGDRGRRDDAT